MLGLWALKSSFSEMQPMSVHKYFLKIQFYFCFQFRYCCFKVLWYVCYVKCWYIPRVQMYNVIRRLKYLHADVTSILGMLCRYVLMCVIGVSIYTYYPCAFLAQFNLIGP